MWKYKEYNSFFGTLILISFFFFDWKLENQAGFEKKKKKNEISISDLQTCGRWTWVLLRNILC